MRPRGRSGDDGGPFPPPARALAAAAGLLLAAPLPAQQPDTLALVVERPVEARVAALPGEPVPLDSLVAIAMDRSLTLAAARTLRRQADARVGVERGAFDPALTAGWSTARDPDARWRSDVWALGLTQALPWGTELGLGVESGTGVAGLGGLVVDPVTGLPTGHVGSAVSFSLSQPLLEGLGTRDADARAAAALRDAAVAGLGRARERLVADVERAYWELAEAEAVQAVLQRSLEIAEALLFRNEQLADRELVPAVDVITARGGVALRRANLVSARRRRLDASDALVYRVWGDAAADRLLRSPSPLKTVPVDVGPLSAVDADLAIEARALDARLEVVAARAALRAAEEVRRAARRAVLPSLRLTGSVSSFAAAPSYHRAFQALGGPPSWSVGLSFAQPLLNRRDRGLGATADLALELRRIDLALAENTVRAEVRSALRGVRAEEERLTAAEEAAAQARLQLQAERQRLDLGLGDTFRLLETEENGVQAELERVRALYDLARAVTAYRLATGTLRAPGG